MSYAVKNGTAEYFWIDNAATPPGHVRYDGPVPGRNRTDANELVWGADISNLRVRTAGELAALPAARLTALHDALVSEVSGGGPNHGRLIVAILLAILDEFNAHATKMNAILAAGDAAPAGAFKTAMQAITDYPTRTKDNLITALTNKINAGSADT